MAFFVANPATAALLVSAGYVAFSTLILNMSLLSTFSSVLGLAAGLLGLASLMCMCAPLFCCAGMAGSFCAALSCSDE